MQSFRYKAIYGVLALVGLIPLAAKAQAKTPADNAATPLSVTVTDSRGSALPGATAKDAAGNVLGRSDESGTMRINCQNSCDVRVEAPGFAAKMVHLTPGSMIQLAPAAQTVQVTVTAYRTPLSALDSPATTRLLTSNDLATAPAVTLDGKMREVPGVETFRRSSSLVANPSSQGVSLRGLGSTSASRTLVTEDDVPLNDPLGGWIHWNETPELAVRDIEVVRGGASDLYGSSAIGGVINVIPQHPGNDAAEVTSSYSGDDTYDEGALAQMKRGPWGLLGAAGMLGTDGYIQESPLQRGPVDVASNVHSQNALVDAEREQGPLRLFVRGSAFDELRHNGTPYQRNGTRLFRYATGGDWQNAKNGTLALRLFGSNERYRQTFSSIVNTPNSANPACSYRCGETPSKYSYVPDNELGAAAHLNEPLGAGLLLLAGADVRDVRVWDLEQSFGSSTAITNLHDHQRDSGLYAEGMWVRKDWTVTASARMDWFQNYDGRQFTWNGSTFLPSATQPPQFGQRVFDPRLGVVRKIGDFWSLSASGFRAFRAPTPNELYRATQVGNQLTKANSSLLSERATGWEAGVASQRRWGTVRASYFLTEVNRPIVALTINPTSSPILLMRENLGQIESKGFSLDYGLAPTAWLALDGGYQYAHAVVSHGSQDLGNWIPEVARNMATINLRASKPRLGTLALMGRLSGHMFDDDANEYLLHGYFRLDVYASHNFANRWEVFADGENLFNRQIEVSKTPTTTLDNGRVGRIGVRVWLGRMGQ